MIGIEKALGVNDGRNAMRIVDLGNGAVGIEPEKPADQIVSIDVPTLRRLGVTEGAITSFSQYVADMSRHTDRSTTLDRAVPNSLSE